MTVETVAELAESYDVEKIVLNGVVLRLPSGQLKPEFANSIDECTDTSKVYVLPDGYIYAYIKTQQWQEGANDLIPLSTVSGGGSVYNEKGYKLNIRLNSTGAEKDFTSAVVTGFIPATRDSVLRIKGFSAGLYSSFNNSGNAILLYDASYSLLTTTQQGIGSVLKSNGIGVMNDETGIYTVTLSDILDNNNIAFVRFSTAVNNSGTEATDEEAQKLIATVDEEITDGYYVETDQWANTGHAFVPADYEDRIVSLEGETADHEKRLKTLEANDEGSGVPEYWLEELETKADTIQQAMESAGRNKSSFLWYTDSHWANGNTKVSPMLLKYLCKNTPLNKVNFGGDIVGDPTEFTHDNIKYVYDWRKLIADLPNHHSVYGNHDVNHRSTNVDKIAYALLIAPEETSEMVVGGDSYYYIDNPSEKTRYLYLSFLSGTAYADEMIEQCKFIADSIKTVEEGWHIVCISHSWFQYTSSSEPTVGAIPVMQADILSVFDAYNARETRAGSNYFYEQDFTDCKGKVEFCIGGHIHVDYDFTSDGGIPVVITASDTNQARGANETACGTIGTTTESAVFGIIADYDKGKITVVGVGRGTSREILLNTTQI